jgi:RNA polymerase sigma-70 factor (ECF subfamily)
MQTPILAIRQAGSTGRRAATGGERPPDESCAIASLTTSAISEAAPVRYPNANGDAETAEWNLDKTVFMQACREGGERIEGALRSLDRSYFAVLYRDCLRAVRDPDMARDLVQDAFIKVWQRCASFRGESELLPWVRSIMRRTILDRVRQPLREVPLENEADPAGEVMRRVAELSATQVPMPEDAMRQRQLAECFKRGWQEFVHAAPEHALVISWIADDGMSHEEVASLLGRTPGATREFISQCRKRARIHLAEWYALAFAPS